MPGVIPVLTGHCTMSDNHPETIVQALEDLAGWLGERHIVSSEDMRMAATAEWAAREAARPIDMVLHCPACGLQHIDAPESPTITSHGYSWTNPPHRSHLCHGCGHIWRPADVPTNGVQAVKTKGENDGAAPSPAAEPIGFLPAHEVDRLKSGHDGHLRSARFGPSQLDGDVPVYLHATAPMLMSTDPREGDADGLHAVARLYYTGMGHRRYRRASTQAGPGEPLCFLSVAREAISRLRAQHASEISRLTAELEEARKDAGRLDWLLPNLHPATFGMDFEGGYEWADDAELLRKWRNAIDVELRSRSAAMTKEKP